MPTFSGTNITCGSLQAVSLFLSSNRTVAMSLQCFLCSPLSSLQWLFCHQLCIPVGEIGPGPSDPRLEATTAPCYVIILQDHGQQYNWGWGHSHQESCYSSCCFPFCIPWLLAAESLVFSSFASCICTSCVCLNTGRMSISGWKFLLCQLPLHDLGQITQDFS